MLGPTNCILPTANFTISINFQYAVPYIAILSQSNSHRAFEPVFPILTRTISYKSVTKTLPSPIIPIFAARR